MKKKKDKKVKTRDWLAVHAFERNRKGGGPHKDKSKYTRHPKHKGTK
tara:strand:+ start:710 stop:850 length:141 start_codon:yes stop_codon:yes gene_type:complete